MLNRFLCLNSEEYQWQGWVLPGPSSLKTNERQWMRSDEMVMARLNSNILTVLGPKWSQYSESSNTPEAIVNPAIETKTTPTQTPPSPTPPVDIVGFWQNKGTGTSQVVLRILNNGDLSWIVFDSKEPRERKARWNRVPSLEPSTYTLTEAQPLSNTSSVPIGQICRESPTYLRFRAEKTHPLQSEWNMAPEMVFEQVTEMPRWKPSPPAKMPVQGTSREEALHLLGKPEGLMHSKEKEVLVYPWGNIWIENGRVTALE